MLNVTMLAAKSGLYVPKDTSHVTMSLPIILIVEVGKDPRPQESKACSRYLDFVTHVMSFDLDFVTHGNSFIYEFYSI